VLNEVPALSRWIKINITLVRFAVKALENIFKSFINKLLVRGALEETEGLQNLVRIERFSGLLKLVKVKEDINIIFIKIVERNYPTD